MKSKCKGMSHFIVTFNVTFGNIYEMFWNVIKCYKMLWNVCKFKNNGTFNVTVKKSYEMLQNVM